MYLDTLQHARRHPQVEIHPESNQTKREKNKL